MLIAVALSIAYIFQHSKSIEKDETINVANTKIAAMSNTIGEMNTKIHELNTATPAEATLVNQTEDTLTTLVKQNEDKVAAFAKQAAACEVIRKKLKVRD